MREHEKPVYIQGLFRSRTTFVLSKFANDPKNTLLDEPLHFLAGKARNKQIDPRVLRHPEISESSLATYPPDVVVPIDLGVKDYFLAQKEPQPVLESYLNRLLDSTEKRPVFKFVRMSLRGNWLANNFPGVHVYVDRDLSGLMSSYFSFGRRLGWYLSEFVTIVGANAESPAFGELAKYLELKKHDGSYQELKSHYKDVAIAKLDAGKYIQQTMIDIVAFFRQLALAQADSYANVSINSEGLRDPKKRRQISDRLTEITGTVIDLRDFKDKVPKEEVSPSENILTIIRNTRL